MTAEQKITTVADSPQWQASLQLQIARRPSGSRLMSAEHERPLYVQRPFYPEGPDCAHIYVLHPPGGIVSGDELRIDVQAKSDSACLLTTPGAGRIYRARENLSRQYQRISLCVEEAASIEWFPLETIVFPGADVALETSIELAEGAHCAAWEITSFGLPANAEAFDRGSFEQRYQVTRSGRPVFLDRFELNPANREMLHAGAGLRGEPVYGFLLMGPFSDGPDEALLAALLEDAASGGYAGEAGISRVGDFYVGRYLGGSAERARKCFQRWWTRLRPPLLGREASAPRVWLT